MTVFKSFFKIMRKNIGVIILYTVLLVLFGGLQFTTGDNQIGFTASKPDISIINNDNSKLADNLVAYLDKHANLIEMDEDKLDDALFYRQVNYIIYIYSGYGEDVLNGKFREFKIKSTGDYMSSLADMMVNRYLTIQSSYDNLNEDELIDKVNSVLDKEVNIEVKTKLNTSLLSKISSYYNFASYTIMAIIILVISLILASYNSINIKKRITVSSTNYIKYNNSLLKASAIYSLIAWLFYNILGLIICGSELISIRGLLFMINSFIYTIICLLISFIISNLLTNKDAISGIVNVLAVGSSFLCGVFVPAEWLSSGVLKVAHIFPTYYYVNANNVISELEVIKFNNLNGVYQNWIIMGIIIIGLFIVNLVIVRYKRKIN